MAEFDENVQLDTSQVEDARGRGGGGFGGVLRGGGGGLPGGGMTVGGGAIGLIIAVLALLFGGGILGGGDSAPYGSLQDQTTDGASSTESIAQRCRTGADANTKDDCRIVGYVNSIQKFWTDEFARRGSTYALAKTQFFRGSTQTGCGAATSQVGPFYCPVDQTVYIDLDFFNELRSKFGASGGSFAQGYVISHEYGHHIQNLLGILNKVDSRDTGPQSDAVRSELQADCFAGIWAHNAVSTGFLTNVTEKDIADALNAAAAVGDDRIQKSIQGRVTPESWTHGSSEQRQRWYTTGFNSGDLNACDTFRGSV